MNPRRMAVFLVAFFLLAFQTSRVKNVNLVKPCKIFATFLQHVFKSYNNSTRFLQHFFGNNVRKLSFPCKIMQD